MASEVWKESRESSRPPVPREEKVPALPGVSDLPQAAPYVGEMENTGEGVMTWIGPSLS